MKESSPSGVHTGIMKLSQQGILDMFFLIWKLILSPFINTKIVTMLQGTRFTHILFKKTIPIILSGSIFEICSAAVYLLSIYFCIYLHSARFRFLYCTAPGLTIRRVKLQLNRKEIHLGLISLSFNSSYKYFYKSEI